MPLNRGTHELLCLLVSLFLLASSMCVAPETACELPFLLSLRIRGMYGCLPVIQNTLKIAHPSVNIRPPELWRGGSNRQL